MPHPVDRSFENRDVRAQAECDHGLAEAVARDPSLARGVNVLDGHITYEAVADAHDLEYTPLDDVLPLTPV